jgi:hypothetical protein
MPRCRLVLLLLALLSACNTAPTGPSAPAGIELVSGGDQHGVAGYPLPEHVVVRVVDDRGNPLRDVELAVATSASLAQARADSWVTDENGEVAFVWQMGASVDGEQLTVAAPDVPSLNTLTITARGGSRALRAIAGGLELYCAVTVDQRLGCWQPLEQGFPVTVPDQPPTMMFRPEGEQFLDVAMGYPWLGFGSSMYGCAIRASGSVACFDHQPGLESLRDIGGTHPPLVRVFANHEYNSQFFCALTAAGEAWCWGKNGGGQLGNGTTDAAVQPTRVETDVRFSQLVLGRSYACGLDASGAAWCWGEDFAGATGTGSFDARLLTPTAVSTPIKFVTLESIGGAATCGRAASGKWWCWGLRFLTRLPQHSAVPQETTIPAGTRIATPDFVALASDPAGDAVWWGDLFPTLDLTIASDPRPADIPFPVIGFLPKVRDQAACVDVAAADKWLCIDLLWLASSSGASWIPTQPLVHGVP